MINVSWDTLKTLRNSNPTFYLISYVDLGIRYLIWTVAEDLRIMCDSVYKESIEGVDFETNYKSYANVNQASRTRITTCKIGRAIHMRYISFTTADQDNYDNTDHKERNFGDATYIMKNRHEVNGSLVWDTVTDPALCNETWIDFEPPYVYEISGGYVDIPPTITENTWEIHVVSVPDIPEQFGGSFILLANPKLKWSAGKTIGIDASLNPKEMTPHATLHTNKLRVIIKHPYNTKEEFQICYQLFK
jgi:hypothetical protein